MVAGGAQVYRLGWVSLFPAPTQLLPEFPELRSLKARLAERGYVEGKNVTFELRGRTVTTGEYLSSRRSSNGVASM